MFPIAAGKDTLICLVFGVRPTIYSLLQITIPVLFKLSLVSMRNTMNVKQHLILPVPPWCFPAGGGRMINHQISCSLSSNNKNGRNGPKWSISEHKGGS